MADFHSISLVVCTFHTFFFWGVCLSVWSVVLSVLPSDWWGFESDSGCPIVFYFVHLSSLPLLVRLLSSSLILSLFSCFYHLLPLSLFTSLSFSFTPWPFTLSQLVSISFYVSPSLSTTSFASPLLLPTSLLLPLPLLPPLFLFLSSSSYPPPAYQKAQSKYDFSNLLKRKWITKNKNKKMKRKEKLTLDIAVAFEKTPFF